MDGRAVELDEGASPGLAAAERDGGLGFESLVAGGEVQVDVVVLDGDEARALARLLAGQVVVDVLGVLRAAG
jgi:predicted nucleic acid-binding protein